MANVFQQQKRSDISFITEMILNIKMPKTKIIEFANIVDPDEVAHNEPPHLDLQCLSSSFVNSQYDSLDRTIFEVLQT